MSTLTEGTLKLAFLLVALLILLWLQRRGKSPALPVAGYWLLIFIGMFTWTNWGAFHEEQRFVHEWDQYHYTLSSKYFAELGHDGLYVATALASREAGGHEPPRIRDLRSGRVVDADTLVDHQREVRARFSNERWASFSSDLKQFEIHPWAYMDHGYNAPPPLTAILRVFTTNLPIGSASKTFYALLDLAFIAGAIGIIAWAFGTRAAAQCAILFGVSFMARYFWNGGSILRYDWFFAITAAACLLKKEHVAAAGIALGYASVIRVFPVFLALPVLAYFLATGGGQGWRQALRFGSAMALIGVLLLGFGAINNGRGIDAYTQMYDKLSEHDGAPPPNNVGMRTFLITSPENMDGQFIDTTSIYETNAITDDLLATAADNEAWIILGTIFFLALSLWYGIRASDASSALLIGLIGVFGATALTCYYWVTLALLPTLSTSRGFKLGLVSNLGMYAWGAIAIYLPSYGFVSEFNGALVFVPCTALALWSLLASAHTATRKPWLQAHGAQNLPRAEIS